MDEREKLMLEKIKPERHKKAMMILATIKNIKEECKKKSICMKCGYCKEAEPENWDEYDMTERICK